MIQRRLRLERAVVVQPSSCGTDNRCTVEAIRELGRDRTRGIAIVDQTLTDRDLEALSDAGVVGTAF